MGCPTCVGQSFVVRTAMFLVYFPANTRSVFIFVGHLSVFVYVGKKQ